MLDRLSIYSTIISSGSYSSIASKIASPKDLPAACCVFIISLTQTLNSRPCKWAHIKFSAKSLYYLYLGTAFAISDMDEKQIINIENICKNLFWVISVPFNVSNNCWSLTIRKSINNFCYYLILFFYSLYWPTNIMSGFDLLPCKFDQI